MLIISQGGVSASHPADRDVFLNMVWEIFDQYQDIALFYEEVPLSQAELLSRLTNMQLIVIPIIWGSVATVSTALPYEDEDDNSLELMEVSSFME